MANAFFRVYALIGVLFVLLTFSVSAQSEQGQSKLLSIDDAINLALKNNFDHRSAGLELKLKEYNKTFFFSPFYPTLSVSGTYSKLNSVESSTVFGKTVTPRSDYLSARLQAQLNISAAQVYSMFVTLKDYDAGLVNYESAEENLKTAVRTSFYNLLFVNENLKYAQDNLNAAKTNYDALQGSYNGGLVDEYSALSARVNYETLKPVVSDIENTRANLLAQFKLMLGLPFDSNIDLAGSIEPEFADFDADALVKKYIENRSDIRSLMAARALASTQHDLAVSSFYPSLSLGFSMDPSYQDKTNPSTTNIGDIKDGEWKQQQGALSITLALDIAGFIPGSTTWARINSSQLAIDQTDLRLQAARLNAEAEIRNIVAQLKRSRDQLEVLKLSLDLADKANQLGQTSYRAGLKSYSQIQATEISYSQARVNYIKEKLNYQLNLFALEKACATPLDKLKLAPSSAAGATNTQENQAPASSANQVSTTDQTSTANQTSTTSQANTSTQSGTANQTKPDNQSSSTLQPSTDQTSTTAE